MPRLGPLTTAARPPAKPVENDIAPAEWAALERALGVGLPDGYKGFIETYGTGTISNYIRILNPFSATDGYLAWLAQTIAADTSARAAEARCRWLPKRPLPAAPFPAEGGLLPFAMWGPSALLQFWTRGEPNQWPIVWAVIGSNDHLVFELPLQTFLDQILRGRLRDPALGVEYPTMQRGAKFIPRGRA